MLWCYARAAELPDEDKQGGKFQQVEGLAKVDAEIVPGESSVEDDFVVDETAEGVDEEIKTVKAILAGKKKELDAMEAFGIFDVCEELPKDAKIITTRWENVPKGDKWRWWFVAREFRHDDSETEGLYTSGSAAATGRLVDVHVVQHGYSILCFDAENAYFHAEGDEEVYWSLPKGKMRRNFNEFVVSATVGLGREHCPEQPSLFRRHCALSFTKTTSTCQGAMWSWRGSRKIWERSPLSQWVLGHSTVTSERRERGKTRTEECTS